MRLLIIGTLDGQIGAASRIAVARGAKVSVAEDVAQGLEALRGEGADLVMVDVRCDIHALNLALENERIVVPIIACGVASDTAAAVRAIKAGAKEYIPLPPDAELIAAVLEAVTEDSHAIVFKDPVMVQMMRMAEQVAASQASILILGESGTGKELMARHIHRKSPRADKRFIAVNCAAIPENLLESELFGYEKGAFTGAVARRIGKFEEANGGTLLLDEISEMDVRLQSKLLRVLQEREVDRIGGSKPIKVDVRILATSNRDMEAEIAKGTFREDLYYRLNVVSLNLPPLRDRPADILMLADHFAKKYADANGFPVRPFAPESQRMLQTHRWRGNVRELENTIHRAVLLASGAVIGPEAIMLSGGSPAAIPAAAPSTPVDDVTTAVAMVMGNGTSGLVGQSMANVERSLIIDTLQHCLGNRTHTANILGISIRTLRNKLKQYEGEGVAIPPPPGGGEQ